jgi:integral membrane protein (TIGR01906 family)
MKATMKKTKYTYKIINILIALCLSLFIISIAVKFTLSFKQLYYFDIDNLRITENYDIKKDVLIKNYDILIDYLQKKDISKLSMPNFPTSKEGEIHFIEVKNIFMEFNTLLYLTGIISILGVIFKLRKKSYSFIKYSSFGLLSIPLILSIPFAVNFDKSFTAFHKMFFSNDYWEFDPVRDPIINVLPQEFFMHCAVLILILIAICSLALFLIHRKLNKTQRDS